MRRVLTLIVLAAAAGPAFAADSTHASLRVGAEVTRRCSVQAIPESGTLDVRCTRSGTRAVQTSVDGRRSTVSPLVISGPGVDGATVPVGSAGTSSSVSVVTILF